MTVSRSHPSALRFLIGHELRSARLRARVSQAAAAQELGCTQPKINNMETGKYQQQPEEAAKLMRLYGADQDQISRIESLVRRADDGTQLAPYSDVLPDWFRTFAGLEALAASQFTYQAMTLTGQLQTEAYAAALLSGGLQIAPLDLPQAIKARMARQRLTSEASPLDLEVVVEEDTLTRLVGGPEVMIEQLRHLLDLTQRPNVKLQVMPKATAVHVGLDGDFTLLSFAEAQSLGYIEYQTGSLYVQDPDQVALYKLIADRLQTLALSADESAQVILEHVDRLQRA
ncbi:helix-turn-helix domain-containing protein [Nocardia vulneris]|uniref:Cro/Cl family transcriptional regulator n=1 Tax=Nocardia vulneris TaxID=1141657 RepID=A0ABR4Z833_9NOCA|nr:helix-turn-helix transcriptional regulator [Nocardia vulneris]KIA61363.1 Cro/Cl family transcriptional regulator [Nocardia vulneris]